MNLNFNAIVQVVLAGLLASLIYGGLNLRLAHSQSQEKIKVLEQSELERKEDHDVLVATGRDIDHIKGQVKDLKEGQAAILEAIRNGQPH